MDSFLIKKLWEPDLCLYVNVASYYAQNEMEHMKQLQRSGISTDVKLVRGIELSRFERDDFIIPYRNVYLILAALNEYERIHPMEKMEHDHEVVEICMGATAGDRVLDKSYKFAEKLSDLLTYLSTPQHWTGGKSREVKVVLPFKDHTKRMLLREYAEKYADDNADPISEDYSFYYQKALESVWKGSFSCYTPDQLGNPCGECKPCFRKTVAFTLEGYRDEDYIQRARKYIVESGIWKQIMDGTYGRAEEEKDIREFMEVTK